MKQLEREYIAALASREYTRAELILAALRAWTVKPSAEAPLVPGL